MVFAVVLAIAVTMGYLFLRHERRVKNPIIDMEVLRSKPFQAANYFNLIYGAAVLGVMSFVPLYATSIYGMSILASGLILTPRSVGQRISSSVTSVSAEWGYRKPMIIGTSLVILSLAPLGLSLSFISSDRTGRPALLGIFMDHRYRFRSGGAGGQ